MYSCTIYLLIHSYQQQISTQWLLINTQQKLQDFFVMYSMKYISSLSCNSVTTQNFIVLSYLHHPKAQILLCR